MLKFGIIAEGPTDYRVIKNMLLGYFSDLEEEPVFVPIQPPPEVAGAQPPPGGWTLVFRSLERKDHEGALQYSTDFLVIHIDTDVQDEPGFDVPRRKDGKELSVSERVACVTEKLTSYIDPAFFEANKNKILFAVAVEQIECWLLPLIFDNDKKKAKKTTGCLDAANRALRKRGEPGLSSKETKFVAAYDKASRGYLKRNRLIEARNINPSLDLFIDQLGGMVDS